MSHAQSLSSGKTDFVLKLLKNDKYMLTSPADRIIICYTVMQDKLSQFAKEDQRVTLHEGFDENLYINHDKSSHLALMIDDCMSLDIYRQLSDLFSKYSRLLVYFLWQLSFFVRDIIANETLFFFFRHLNVSVFYCTQNVYNRGSTSAIRHNRDILINSNEVCIFRSTRDHGMALTLGRQV